MMLTLAAANRRLARLEARRPGWAGYPPLEPPSEEFMREVLRMLAEAGGLQGERFAAVCAALQWSDDPQ